MCDMPWLLPMQFIFIPAMMSYGDMVLGEMVQLLIRQGMWENTFLYVTSDVCIYMILNYKMSLNDVYSSFVLLGNVAISFS